ALIGEHPGVPSVVDPVMIPSRRAAAGAALHGASLEPLRALATAATLVTPNLAEAGALLGREIASDAEARDAAAAQVEAGAQAALVKGGHGAGPEAVDWLAVRSRLVRIARPRRRT